MLKCLKLNKEFRTDGVSLRQFASLKRDNQLHFFRRLEKCSKRLIKCEGSIEFLRLCTNFGVTPTFAQVDRRKARKWKKSSDDYQKQVSHEELRAASPKYQLDLEIAKKSNFFKLAQNEALRALVTKISF